MGAQLFLVAKHEEELTAGMHYYRDHLKFACFPSFVDHDKMDVGDVLYVGLGEAVVGAEDYIYPHFAADQYYNNIRVDHPTRRFLFSS